MMLMTRLRLVNGVLMFGAETLYWALAPMVFISLFLYILFSIGFIQFFLPQFLLVLFCRYYGKH